MIMIMVMIKFGLEWQKVMLITLMIFIVTKDDDKIHDNFDQQFKS